METIPSVWLVQCKHSHGCFCKTYGRQTPTSSANTHSNPKATCLHSLASCLRKQFLWKRSIYWFGLWDMKKATQHLVSLVCVGKIGSYRHFPHRCSWSPQHCKNSFLARLKPTDLVLNPHVKEKDSPFLQHRTLCSAAVSQASQHGPHSGEKYQRWNGLICASKGR